MNENELKNKSSLGVASLTLGVVSIVLAIFWYISIPTGILAIVLGKKAINRIGSKLGKAGLITGIIGLSLFVFIYLSIIAMILVSNFL
jgi:hypothetical protein